MTDKHKAANRYLNLIRNKRKREYGWAYLAWLANGGYGNEPEKGRLSMMGAQAVRLQLGDILGGDPFGAMRDAE